MWRCQDLFKWPEIMVLYEVWCGESDRTNKKCVKWIVFEPNPIWRPKIDDFCSNIEYDEEYKITLNLNCFLILLDQIFLKTCMPRMLKKYIFHQFSMDINFFRAIFYRPVSKISIFIKIRIIGYEDAKTSLNDLKSWFYMKFDAVNLIEPTKSG